MTVVVSGIYNDSELAARLDTIDGDGDGAKYECDYPTVLELLALFVAQGKGTFNVEHE